VVANPGHVHSLDAIDALVETHLAFLPGLLGDDLPAYWSEPALVPLFLGASVFPNPLYPEVPHFALLPDEREAIDSELTVINGELEQAEPSRIYLKVALLKCLVLMARAFVRQWPEGPHVPFRHEVRKAMGLVENAVRAGGAVSIADLAARVSLSHKRFDTVFKESTGLSPTEYVMRRRVQWAARLLLAPDAHITEVALQCGYADAAHFSNTFRRYFGMSPRKYRRQYQAEPGRSDGGTPPPPARPR